MDERLARWVGVGFFFFYLLTASGREHYGDESRYLSMARNLLLHGKPQATIEYPDASGKMASASGYVWYPLGQSLLLLPFAAAEMAWKGSFPGAPEIASRLIILALPAAQCATMTALLFLLIRMGGAAGSAAGRRGALSRKAALAMAMAAGFATQLWPAASTLYADTSGAFFIVVAVWCLARFRLLKLEARWLVLAAAAAAFACLCKNPFALACPALAIYGLWELVGRYKRDGVRNVWRAALVLLLCAIPFLAVAGVQLWYNWLRYGSVWRFGYEAHAQTNQFGYSTPLVVGLYGLFLSSGRSFFLYSPPCLLALVGARRFARKLPAEAALVAGVCVPLILFYAKWWAWYGGWEWGARFFIFMIPLLMWMSAPAWQWLDRRVLPSAARRWRLAACGLLLAASIFVQLMGVLIHPKIYWQMLVQEVSIFKRPVFEKGVWEPRDDALLAHFVPDFNPVSAHAWLVWATWNQDRLSESELLARCPWRGLNEEWTPRSVKPYLGFNIWFCSEWRRADGTRVGTAAAALLFAALCALCFGNLFRLLRLRDEFRPG
ncbi:MAG: hypothetical protein NTX50_03095 [Candidatus Sumerlaeota bacterium]|nr:hypothetical protein [Candidatus Sumerlaeota bacterium]